MRRVLLPLVVVVGALQGCASDSNQPDGDEPDLGPVPTVTSYADVRLPLDGYRLRPDQERTVGRAVDLLITSCVLRFGLDYPAPDQWSDGLPDRVIGVVDADEAARLGYRHPGAAANDRDVAVAKAREVPPPPELRAVLTGTEAAEYRGIPVPPGGCVGAANREVGKEKLDALVLDLRGEAVRRTEADHRVKNAFGAWSSCMDDAGHPFPDPWAANDHGWPGDTAGPDEIATARADVACRTETGLNGVWVATLTAYERRLVERDADALTQLRRHADDQVRRATDILAGN
ncbi:hypothetical protein [Actinokineospora sp. NBRC 105648]|uniref:hypothetical protein n=1 Tax=Actinokineospora sp. NBRC 105648 TaxID=3032206 RepID=UPI0024A088A2|nr:hypothetical protein [Actinokineospora sp. NBRC 105648]GLZ38925.1 hypothetical protein Acsp05_25490 [Actinokineospora sp. NBRC 105648]